METRINIKIMHTQQDREKSIQDTLEIVVNDKEVMISWDENVNPEYNYLSKLKKEEFEKIFVDSLKNFLEKFTDGENVFTAETKKE